MNGRSKLSPSGCIPLPLASWPFSGGSNCPRAPHSVAFAARLTPTAVEALRTLFLEDGLSRPLGKERQTGGLLPSLREYIRRYQVDRARLARARPEALVMHPGPMNEGVEIAADVASGAQSLIEEQVRNGVAVRMALLYLLAGTVRP